MGDDGRLLHDPARRDHRGGRQSVHHGRARRQLRRRHLGHQRLPARLRGAAAGRGPSRRPVRAEEPVPARPCGLHRGLGVVRSCRLHRDADRRARRAGHRRGAAHPADAVHGHPDLPCRAPRCADERLGRHCRGRDPGRSTGRRCPCRRARLAVDLLRQRADRHRRPRPGHAGWSRSSRPTSTISICPVWCFRARPCS